MICGGGGGDDGEGGEERGGEEGDPSSGGGGGVVGVGGSSWIRGEGGFWVEEGKIRCLLRADRGGGKGGVSGGEEGPDAHRKRVSICYSVRFMYKRSKQQSSCVQCSSLTGAKNEE